MNEVPNFSGAALEEVGDALASIAGDCRSNPELRAELDADPRAFLSGRGMDFPADADLRVVANSPGVFHVVIPSDPNAAVSDETLATVAGGTPGAPAQCASTVSTMPSCVGCASSVA